MQDRELPTVCFETRHTDVVGERSSARRRRNIRCSTSSPHLAAPPFATGSHGMASAVVSHERIVAPKGAGFYDLCTISAMTWDSPKTFSLWRLSGTVSLVSSESESRKRRSPPRQHFTWSEFRTTLDDTTPEDLNGWHRLVKHWVAWFSLESKCRCSFHITAPAAWRDDDIEMPLKVKPASRAVCVMMTWDGIPPQLTNDETFVLPCAAFNLDVERAVTLPFRECENKSSRPV